MFACLCLQRLNTISVSVCFVLFDLWLLFPEIKHIRPNFSSVCFLWSSVDLDVLQEIPIMRISTKKTTIRPRIVSCFQNHFLLKHIIIFYSTVTCDKELARTQGIFVRAGLEARVPPSWLWRVRCHQCEPHISWYAANLGHCGSGYDVSLICCCLGHNCDLHETGKQKRMCSQ